MTAPLSTQSTSNKPLRGPLRKRESHLWERDPLDFYCEPEWCSQRLFEVEEFEGGIIDPACGLGRIVEAARAAGHHAIGSDIAERVEGWWRFDFLASDFPQEICMSVAGGECSNIVSNPPFGLAQAFVEKALAIAEHKVAMLLPANWVQGQRRARWLAATPLSRVYFLCPRPSMPPGHIILAGGKPGNGTTDYAWFIWNKRYEGEPAIRWLHRDGACGP